MSTWLHVLYILNSFSLVFRKQAGNELYISMYASIDRPYTFIDAYVTTFKLDQVYQL